MIGVKELYDWQQRLQAQPRVWTVFISDRQGEESTGNYYDSKEGARCEIDWYKRHRPAERPRLGTIGNVHTLELARERWR